MTGSFLYVRAPDEGTRIEVLDPNLQPITLPHNTGETRIEVPPGVYAVRFRRGLAITEKLALVGQDVGDVSVTLDEAEEPVFGTAAPVLQAGEAPSPQQRAAESLSLSAPHVIGAPSVDNGRLLLFVREFDPSKLRLATGITLHQVTGEELARIDDIATSNLDEGWTGVHLSLAAGAYRIRRQFAANAFEQIVHVRHEWQTQYFAKALASEDGGLADFALLAVMMAHEMVGFDGSKRDGRFTEAALRALRERSAISGPMSESLLQGKFDNPLLGVMGGLLQLRRKDVDLDGLRQVVENLLWLVGPSPDVLAIGLGMLTRDPALRNDTGFRERICIPGILEMPPYFSESWRHICDASQWDPSLIPVDSLSARAAASITQASPWFRWRVTPDTSPPPADPRIIKSGGLLGTVADGFLASLGIASKSIESLTAEVLSKALLTIQASLEQFDHVGELLRSNEFSDTDRRIAGFVHPLTDPALEALLSTRKEHADALREAVLARGRDGRELARALQLPLGTATIQASSLGAKLAAAVRGLESVLQIKTFVDRESRGDAELRAALEALREIRLPVRRLGRSEPVDALQFLVLRYDHASAATAAKQGLASAPEPLRLLDAQTGLPADAELLSKSLRTAQKALAVHASARVKTGKRSLSRSSNQRVVAALNTYRPGQLFATTPKAPAKSRKVKKAKRVAKTRTTARPAKTVAKRPKRK